MAGSALRGVRTRAKAQWTWATSRVASRSGTDPACLLLLPQGPARRWCHKADGACWTRPALHGTALPRREISGESAQRPAATGLTQSSCQWRQTPSARLTREGQFMLRTLTAASMLALACALPLQEAAAQDPIAGGI